MKALFAVIAVAALCVPCAAEAQAQAQSGEMRAERVEGTRWVIVEMVKFLPGKRARAAEIVEGPVTLASNDIGGGVIDLHLNTGEWDFITILPMPGGPADLTWATSPTDVRFMNALAKHAGGMEGARKLMAEWGTLVAKTERHIAHRHDNLK